MTPSRDMNRLALIFLIRSLQSVSASTLVHPGLGGGRFPRRVPTHLHLPEAGPVVLRNRDIDDPGRLREVLWQGVAGGGEVRGSDVGPYRFVVTERLDQYVLGGILEAAGPLEPQAARLC